MHEFKFQWFCSLLASDIKQKEALSFHYKLQKKL